MGVKKKYMCRFTECRMEIRICTYPWGFFISGTTNDGATIYHQYLPSSFLCLTTRIRTQDTTHKIYIHRDTYIQIPPYLPTYHIQNLHIHIHTYKSLPPYLPIAHQIYIHIYIHIDPPKFSCHTQTSITYTYIQILPPSLN